jgi:hypothetical protein
MDRRAFIAVVGTSIVAVSVGANAQQSPKVHKSWRR